MCWQTPQLVKSQCELATTDERLIVSPTLAEDIFQDYSVKIMILRQIHDSHLKDLGYVDVNMIKVEEYKRQLAKVVGSTGISNIRGIFDYERQK